MNFEIFTSEITRLIAEGNLAEVRKLAESFAEVNCSEYQVRLTQMVLCFVKHDFKPVDSLAIRLKEQLVKENSGFPEQNSIYSVIWLQAQLNLDRRERAATRAGYELFKKNIKALAQIDPELAEDIRCSKWPDLILVNMWQGLHLYDQKSRILMTMSQETQDDLDKLVKERAPIAFGSICSGQEICYCLKRPFKGIHGMERLHYVYEPDIGMSRAFLYLSDLSDEINQRNLVLLTGDHACRQGKKLLSTLRYPSPAVIVGNYALATKFFQDMDQYCDDLVPDDEGIENYYGSDEFHRRLIQIADGKIMPRILVVTCRWTTFLKYCASDFCRAFENLGCQTRYLIEENDVQNLTPAIYKKYLDEFRPDAVFMVSHARPTYPHLPKELPIIAYIQDKCGKILTLDDWRGSFEHKDFFVCLCPYLEDYMQNKQVPSNHTMILPLPVDENMYYPLEKTHPDREKFLADISFVKHGHPAVEGMFANFLKKIEQQLTDESARNLIIKLFTWLHQEATRNCDLRYYESDLLEQALRRIKGNPGPELIAFIEKYVATYYITIHSAAWRCYYLEAIANVGMDLALYGNDWHKHERLGKYARGPIDREKQLKSVYNFSKINLHISQSATMHQRLVECALSSGFMLVSNHDPARDGAPTRPYFEDGREIVFFDTAADLVEKCRYYLEHEVERLEIAQRFRQRALNSMTMRKGAAEVLDRWKDFLKRQLQAETVQVI